MQQLRFTSSHFNLFKRILSPPVFADDEDKTRLARGLHAVLVSTALISLVFSLFILLSVETKLLGLVILVGLCALLYPLFVLSHRGKTRLAAALFVICFWISISIMVFVSGGLSSITAGLYIPLLTIALLFLGWRESLFTFVITLIYTLIFFVSGLFALPQGFTLTQLESWGVLTIGLTIIAVPISQMQRNLIIALHQAQQQLGERHKTEQSLSDSEERFRLISSVTSDYTFSTRFDDKGGLEHTVFSGAFKTITGYTTDEFDAIGGWIAIVHPDDRAQDAYDMATLRQNKSVITEIRIIRKDGRICWVRSYGYPVWDAAQQKLVGIYGAVQDINEHKLAEEALVESENRYRVVSQLISDYAFAYDILPDGTLSHYWITEASFKRLTGFDPHERETGYTLYHPDDVDKVREHIQKTVTGEAISDNYRIITKSGEMRWIHIQRQVEWDEKAQRVIRFYGAAQDITERKLAEEAVQENENRYRIVSELISDYAYAYDIQPDGTYTSYWITEDSFKRLTGFTWGETGTSFDLYHPDDAKTAYEDVQQTIKGKATSGEYRIITKSGETRWIHIRRQVEWSEKEKRFVRFYGAAQDITERKLAESALAKDRKLLRTVIDSQPDNIAVKDRNGKFLLNNTVSMRLLGVSRQEDLLGKDDFDFLPYDRAQMWFQIQQQVMESGLPATDVEFFQPWHSDKRRWLHYNHIPLRDDKGEVTGILIIDHDISERKRAESELAKDRKLLRTVIDHLPDNIFVKDIEGHFVLNNKESIRRLKASNQEALLGKTDFDFFPHEIAEEWAKEQQQVIQSGESVLDIEEFQVRNGIPYWTLRSLIILRDDPGTVTGLIGINRDISARKQAEESLREKEALLRALLNATPDIAFLMSPIGHFLTVNKPLAESLDSTIEDVLGKNGFDFLNIDLRVERYKQFQKCIETRQPVQWEDGRVNFWWDNRFYPVLSESGEVEAVAAYSKNITEEKRLAAELQRYATQLERMVEERTAEVRLTKEQIEIILHNTRDAIALAQSNGDIETRNPAFIAMFGEQVSKWIERLVWSVTDEEHRTVVGKALMHTIHNQESQRVEIRIVSGTGEEKDIDLAFIPVQLTDKENRTGILVSAHDITHIKQIERFKSRFINDAIHDLATPIAGLTNRLYLLKRSPEKLDEHLNKLENQVGHLRNLLDDLRNLAQLDRGQLALHLESSDINRIVARVFDTYEPVALSKGQILTLEAEAHLPQIQLDDRQMERVFVNLVSNAINYTPNGNSITVRTGIDDDCVILSVSDSGIGISPEDLTHVFERFYRADSGRSLQSTGTGLGLAIVKEIVERHGGSVTVESEVGKGSTFTVRLPITP